MLWLFGTPGSTFKNMSFCVIFPSFICYCSDFVMVQMLMVYLFLLSVNGRLRKRSLRC